MPSGERGAADDEYAAEVLALVRRIPAGRVMTYGLVAEVVSETLESRGQSPQGGPRQVGTVMSRFGSEVPWWRVVTADGRVPEHHRARALDALRSEGTPLTSHGEDARVRVRSAVWWP